MKKVQSFQSEINDLQRRMIAEIKNFFKENKMKKIKIEDVKDGYGDSVELDGGTIEVFEISNKGVLGEMCSSNDMLLNFEELKVNDLQFVLDIINSFVKNN